MGNQEVKLAKDTYTTDISKKDIKDFQEQIYMVDNSLSGFVKTIDSVRASCEILLRQLDTKWKVKDSNSKAVQKNEENQNSEQLIANLLKTIHETVFNQRFMVLKTVSSMMHRIMETGSRVMCQNDLLCHLEIDDYLLNKVSDGNDQNRNQMPYYEQRVTELRREVEMARNLNNAYQENMGILRDNENKLKVKISKLQDDSLNLEANLETMKLKCDEMKREMNLKEVLLTDTYRKNEDLVTQNLKLSIEFQNVDSELHSLQKILEEKNHYLNSHKIQMDDLLDKKEQEKNILKSEKIDLENELKNIKKPQFIEVQVFQSRLTQNKPTNIILEKINSKLQTEENELKVTTVAGDLEIRSDIPLLVICDTYFSGEIDLYRPLPKVKVTKTVLIVMHRDKVLERSGDPLQHENFQNLQGIFEFVYSFTKGVPDCDVNNDTLENLLMFINREGLRIPKVVAYGLCAS